MQNQTKEYKIFIGGIGYDIEEDEFKEKFEQFGDVSNWSFYDGRGYAFVSYRRRMDAENAIQCMDNACLGLRRVTVEWANGYQPSESQEEDGDGYEIDADEYESVYNMACENNHSVFCKGLARHTTKETLENIFNPFGVIENIDLYTHSSNYAIIQYNSKEAATLAICAINDTLIHGLQVKCSWSYSCSPGDPSVLIGAAATQTSSSVSSSDSSHSSSMESGDNFDRIFNQTTPDNCTVYCGGLTPSTTEELIKQIFSPFGIIESIRLFLNGKDYGFIRFNTKEAACLAICSINGTLIDDWPVRCSWAHRPEAPLTELQQSSAPSPESSSTSVSQSSALSYESMWPTPSQSSASSSESRLPSISQSSASSSESRLPSISQPSEVSLESKLTSISQILDRLSIRLDRVGARAAAYEPSTEDESQMQLNNQSQPKKKSIEKQEGAAKPKEKKIDLLCKICMDEELGIVFLPCGHLTTCEKCAQKIFSCPMCRSGITGKVRTYLS